MAHRILVAPFFYLKPVQMLGQVTLRSVASLPEFVMMDREPFPRMRDGSSTEATTLSNPIRPDKRRYLRYEILDYAVVYFDGLSQGVNTVIADISLGGVQLRSKAPLPVGETCTIRVGSDSEAPLGLRAEVRHSKVMEDGELFTSGLRFIPETHADRMAIAEYVHSVFQRQCDNLLV